MKNTIGFLIFFLLVIWTAGCKMGTEAGGRETDVIVLCTDADWDQAGSALDKAFSVTEETPQEQRAFDLMRADLEDLELYRFRKNLILMGGVRSSVFDDILSEETKVMVRSGESFMFGSIDGWINGQILVMIVAPADRPLSDIVEMVGPRAVEYFRSHCLERIRSRIYRDGAEEEVKAHLKKSYGWSLDLPKGYRLATEDSSGGFVSFIRHNPERVILVHWGFEKGARTWIDVRNSMSLVYLQGDEVSPDRVTEETVNFRGHKARKLRGHWENEQKVMGGPFVSYCFQDTVSGVYYMVDYNVFAPTKRKWPILGQTEWIAQTFTLYR